MKYNMKRIIKLQSLWHATSLANYFKKRRLKFINSLIEGTVFSSQNLKILDVGCNTGKDFIKLLQYNKNLELYGIDLNDNTIEQENFTFVKCDAEKLPFTDNFFDLTISIGTLEHITPIEKLSRVISEIRRVSRSYCILVPSIDTFLEPHTFKIKYQLKNYKAGLGIPLIFLSDEAWLSFEGFSNAKITRFKYMPLIEQQCVYSL